jgi:DNA mismatch repair protein MutL
VSAAPPRPIRRLEPATVARIAAGEVVENPASVVKELVENAWDAGATEVRVEIEGGGLERLRVTDDGFGIRPEELGLALERHATSKLEPAGDPSGIESFGFRGEALASIAAVSRLSLASRIAGAEAAEGVRIEGGTEAGRFTEGGPPGTTVEVRSLFYNTPARRKFLRTPLAEQVDVARVVGGLYLARPSVGLTLVAAGREIARYPATARLRDAAVRVLGEELLGQTVELRAPPEAGVHGGLEAVLGRPTVSRGNSTSLYVAVNGRWVQARSLSQAVRRAYDDFLPKGRFPMGVVHLAVDPDRVDVNVHPTKREVRLAREREIADSLRRAIRQALQRQAGPADLDAGRAQRALRLPATGAGPAESALSLPLREAPRSAAPGVQRLLDARARARPVDAGPGHPRLELLGCLFDLYWVSESDGALVLVDQHAASERLVYDTLLGEGRLARQELVEPVTVSLTARQASTLEANGAAIADAGFALAPFGGGRHRVSSVPVYRGRRSSVAALLELLDELADGGRPSVPDGLIERRAASIACHSAVRAGDSISAEEMGRILDSLRGLEGPSYACPHGRPIEIRVDRGRLDRWFLRSPP